MNQHNPHSCYCTDSGVTPAPTQADEYGLAKKMQRAFSASEVLSRLGETDIMKGLADNWEKGKKNQVLAGDSIIPKPVLLQTFQFKVESSVIGKQS
jgi:hypothetical protein